MLTFLALLPVSKNLIRLLLLSIDSKGLTEEDVGLLVQVSYYITAFTLPAYQRGSLPRPSKDDSS